MALNKAPLAEEFRKLMAIKLPPVFWSFRAEIIIEGKTYPISDVRSVSVDSDFIENYSDIIKVTMEIPRYFYYDVLIPNKRNFQVKLIKEQISPIGETIKSPETSFRVYDGKLERSDDPSFSVSSREDVDKNERELVDTETVSFQLMEPVVTETRLVGESNIYRDVTLEDVIKFTLSHGLGESESKSTLLDATNNRLRGVEVAPLNNEKEYRFVMLPSGLRLIDVPQYLQFNKGLYSTGLGYYFRQGWWFTYPLFNTKRFPTTKKTATVLLVPETELPTVERSYQYRSEQLYIVATGAKALLDMSEYANNNDGDAFKFFKSDLLLDNFVKTSNNVTSPRLEETRKEFSIRKRSDGLSNIKQPSHNFTENPYKHLSTLSKNLGKYLVVNWDNCSDDLLFPGMPVRVLRDDGTDIKEAFGTLLRIDSWAAPATDTLINKEFRTQATLTIFLESDDVD